MSLSVGFDVLLKTQTQVSLGHQTSFVQTQLVPRVFMMVSLYLFIFMFVYYLQAEGGISLYMKCSACCGILQTNLPPPLPSLKYLF